MIWGVLSLCSLQGMMRLGNARLEKHALEKKAKVWLQKPYMIVCVARGSTQPFQQKPGIEMGLIRKDIQMPVLYNSM